GHSAFDGKILPPCDAKLRPCRERGMSQIDVLLVCAGDTAALAPDMLSRLSADEHARALRFYWPSDRALYALGRALLRYGLRERFGITAARLRIAPDGKPRL